MNDNEIIKSLECCSKEDYNFDCDKCPYEVQCRNNENIMPIILDLINRQKAEIEKLKEQKKLYLDRWKESLGFIEEERVKIIGEFAQRLTDNASLSAVNSFQFAWLITQDEIDNLIKEMTEDSNE